MKGLAKSEKIEAEIFMSIKINPFQNIEAFKVFPKETNPNAKNENENAVNLNAETSSADNLHSFTGEMQKFQLLQKLFSADVSNAKTVNNVNVASLTNLNNDDDEVLKKTQELIDNYRRQIKPNEIKGSNPVAPNKSPGHSYSKHKVEPEVQTEIMNKPERVFSGKNDNGRFVDIYYKNGSVVITEQGDKGRVITAYGLIDKRKNIRVKPFNLERILKDPNYVEINLEKLGSTNVIYPNRERFDKNDFPSRPNKPDTPAKTNGGGTSGGNTEVKPNVNTQPKANVSTNTEVPVTPKSPTVNEEIKSPKPTGRLSGNMIRGLAVMQLVQIGLTALNFTKLKEDSAEFGYYVDPFLDKYIISDPDKAAKNLGEGFELTFYLDPTDYFNQGKSVIFTVKDGKFTNPNGWQLVYNEEKGYTEAVLTA